MKPGMEHDSTNLTCTDMRLHELNIRNIRRILEDAFEASPLAAERVAKQIVTVLYQEDRSKG
jgi:hypothetical protein